MYQMKNLAPAQLAYIKKALLKHGVELTGIAVSGDTLCMSRNLGDGRSDIVMTTVHHGQFWSGYYATDPGDVAPTEISVSNTIVRSVIDQFQQVNSMRIGSLYDHVQAVA